MSWHTSSHSRHLRPHYCLIFSSFLNNETLRPHRPSCNSADVLAKPPKMPPYRLLFARVLKPPQQSLVRPRLFQLSTRQSRSIASSKPRLSLGLAISRSTPLLQQVQEPSVTVSAFHGSRIWLRMVLITVEARSINATT